MKTIVMLSLLPALLAPISYGLDKVEKVECLKWQDQASEYHDWFATEWQEKQCEAHGIEL